MPFGDNIYQLESLLCIESDVSSSIYAVARLLLVQLFDIATYCVKSV